jgi:hypothetical protein
LHCRADDAETIARHMTALHDDGRLRESMAAKGRARAGRFTWAATARALLEHCLDLGAERAVHGLDALKDVARRAQGLSDASKKAA